MQCVTVIKKEPFEGNCLTSQFSRLKTVCCLRSSHIIANNLEPLIGAIFLRRAMSILQNAIDSIQVGVEDYNLEDDRRNASAIRNIFAGILLLYKERLCELS
jgi:hypothetical protein